MQKLSVAGSDGGDRDRLDPIGRVPKIDPTNPAGFQGAQEIAGVIHLCGRGCRSVLHFLPIVWVTTGKKTLGQRGGPHRQRVREIRETDPTVLSLQQGGAIQGQ